MILLNLTVLKSGKIKETFLLYGDTTFQVRIQKDSMQRRGKILALFRIEENTYTVSDIKAGKVYDIPSECVGKDFSVSIVNDYSGGTSSTEFLLVRTVSSGLSSDDANAIKQAVTDWLNANPDAVAGLSEEQKNKLEAILLGGDGSSVLSDNGSYIDFAEKVNEIIGGNIEDLAPTITENTNNTDGVYKLDITDVNGTFTTPNLKGGGAGGSGDAEDTSYTNENYPQYTNVDLALDALFNKVYYVKPTCSLSADKKGGTFEIGAVITAPITFTWTTNKEITSQSLTGCTLADASVRTANYNTDITSDKTFTLSVSDGENSATSSVSYKFMNNVFWGSSAIAETYDSAFIGALANKKLTTSVKGTYAFDVKNGEYGFWAVPSNMTISSVWIGGFEVTVESVGTVSYTNAQGYTRDYNLYKTVQSGLGTISAEIK